MISNEKDDSLMDEESDLYNDDEGSGAHTDLEFPEEDGTEEIVQEDTPSPPMHSSSPCKMETRRRLDAYLERKWFRDQGWEDDEFFNDEYFVDTLGPLRHSV